MSSWEDRLFALEPEADPAPCEHKPKWCQPLLPGDPGHPDPSLCEAWRCRCGGVVIRLHPHHSNRQKG